MALIPALQDEAERVQRRAAQQVAIGNRRIAGYNKEADSLRGLMAADKKTVEDYNKQYEGFRESAVKSFDKDPNGELWNIIGFYGGTPNAVVQVWDSSGQSPLWEGTNWHHPSWAVTQTGNNPYSTSSVAFTGGDRTTFRDLRTGDPLSAPQFSWGNKAPVYASFNDRPFVKPVTQEQIAQATASNESLKGYGPQIDTLNEKGESISARTGLMQQRSEREVDRLNTDIEMNKRRIAEEQAGPQSGSVFEQNMAGVFQSIADWLR